MTCPACGEDMRHEEQDAQIVGDRVLTTVDTWTCAKCNLYAVQCDSDHIRLHVLS